MKTITKILSVTLLIVMCMSLFTLSAYAVEPNDTWHQSQGLTADCVLTYVPSTTSCAGLGYKEHYVCQHEEWYSGPTISDATHIGNPAGYMDTVKPAHTLVAHAAVAPTCKDDGNIAYWTCSVCGKYFSDAAGTAEITSGATLLPKGKHTPTAMPIPYVAPTCASDGHIAYYVCTTCGQPCDAAGNPFANIVISKDTAAHNYGPWTTVKEATNVSPGERVRSCTVCGTKEYETIPATGIVDGMPIYPVIVNRDTWCRGEEPLIFSSTLIQLLNDAGAGQKNYVGVRIGTDSLYQNSYATYDFWSWDDYVQLGTGMMGSLRAGTYRLWIYDTRHPDIYTNSVTFYVVDVPTLDAYNTDKHVVNSSKNLRFIASEAIDPNSVWVGSKKLYDANDYFVSNDGKSITLSADFLNARQTGTYTISAVTKNGQTIKTNFYVLSSAQASTSPRTGDESQLGLWAAFLLLSGAAVIVIVPRLRKHGAK